MHKALCLSAMLLGATLAGCASAQDPGPKDFTITLERGICFGACPIYRVSVANDGRVSYDGQRFVAVTGHQTRKIAPEKARALYDAFMRAKFFAFDDAYRAGVTDMPTYRLTLKADGQSKTITDYAGRMAGMPQEITDLENLVDETAGSKDWVRPQPAN